MTGRSPSRSCRNRLVAHAVALADRVNGAASLTHDQHLFTSDLLPSSGPLVYVSSSLRGWMPVRNRPISRPLLVPFGVRLAHGLACEAEAMNSIRIADDLSRRRRAGFSRGRGSMPSVVA